MDWLNNANTIARLVMALIGLGGSLYGAASYLTKKASRIPPDVGNLSKQSSGPSPRPSTPLPEFTWLEWTELLAQGLVDTADFLLHICSQSSEIDEDMSVMARLGLGLLLYGMGLGLGTLILGTIIGALLAGLGVRDPSGASSVIAFILLFAVLSFIYIYHIGRRVEQKRLEQYQSFKQQTKQASARR